MASQHGQVGEFNESLESIADYLDRMYFYFEANDITSDEKKRAVLLTNIGQRQFRLLKDLCQPQSLSTKTYAELCQTLKDHHSPPPSKFLQRAKFEARNRKHGESIQSYCASLKNIAEFCDFGENLSERLCEKFVTGIGDTNIQRKLLLEKDLTFSRAYEIALTVSQTMESAKSMTSGDTINYTSVHQISKSRPNLQSSNQGGRSNRPNFSSECYRCGGPHSHQRCNFRNSTCFFCNKVGHIAKVCRSRSTDTKTQTHSNQTARQSRQNRPGKDRPRSSGFQQQPSTNRPRPCLKSKFSSNHLLEESPATPQQRNFDSTESCDEFNLFTLGPVCDQKQALHLNIEVDKQLVDFQIDTGAALTVMTQGQYEALFDSPLRKSNTILKTYTGESVPVVGEKIVAVCHNGQDMNLPLLVVNGQGPPLLGRNWLASLKLDWKNSFSPEPERELFSQDHNPHEELNQVLKQYESVFKSSGLLKDIAVKIHLKQGATPIFKKARQPPYTLREGIEAELTRLANDNIIKPVEFSDWATPIVPVLKKNGAVRICGDYKATINRHTQCDHHPIPRIEDLIQKLVGGKKFTKIDFSNAYQQLQLDKESRELTTINTHKGLFQFQRLCFGISAAPGIFQRVMESIFQNVPMSVTYFDDLFITGHTDEEHIKNLEAVLAICKAKGLAINKDKCEFMRDQVTFLGHKLNKDGIQPLDDTVRAIKEAPPPTNLHELRSFLGLINHYSKFIPGSSNVLAPLYSLLQKNTRWCWGKIQNEAFLKAKSLLSSDKILVHFNPRQPIILTCDASPVGVGAVLSHIDSEGHERPISYASRSLSCAEKKYSQVDREALSIIFGVKKFHKYILGQNIKIVTDHKPLLGILGESKPIPEHSSARVQRWALTLSAYSYNLEYRPGKENNADLFSRLPLQTPESVQIIPEEINTLFSIIESGPISSNEIAHETKRDPLLRRVLQHTYEGWPEKCDVSLRPFASRKQELSIEKDCLLWGTRVVIPGVLQSKVLELIHDTHIGVARMKALARSWVWWQNIDADIERSVKMCYTCQLHRNEPVKAPLHPWDWPTEPWSRIHLDFAGPFLGHMYLIIADAHSKWLDVKIMNKITASSTILELRDVFSTLGLPDTIVTDNGPTFTSFEFSKFMSHNGVKHITTSPYHPASNGLAERNVQTFKNAMIKIDGKCVRERVCKFLTKYRTCPHSTTGVSPAELMFGRKLKTHLDLLHPSLTNQVYKQQSAQRHNHNLHSREREIGVNDHVFVRNYSTAGERWMDGVVTQKTGPVSYKVQTNLGSVRRHQDQLREKVCTNPESLELEEKEIDKNITSQEVNDAFPPDVERSSFPMNNTPESSPQSPRTTCRSKLGTPLSNTKISHSSGHEILRRSTRQIKPPDRLTL